MCVCVRLCVGGCVGVWRSSFEGHAKSFTSANIIKFYLVIVLLHWFKSNKPFKHSVKNLFFLFTTCIKCNACYLHQCLSVLTG